MSVRMVEATALNRRTQSLAGDHSDLSRRARHDDEKLFATESAGAITLAHVGRDDLTDSAQAAVAGEVPKVIVDRLKVVDID